MTILVARERDSRMTCTAFLRELGAEHTAVILTADGEAAIKVVVDDVAALRPSVRTIQEEAQRGSSGSNGIVERASRSLTRRRSPSIDWRKTGTSDSGRAPGCGVRSGGA